MLDPLLTCDAAVELLLCLLKSEGSHRTRGQLGAGASIRLWCAGDDAPTLDVVPRLPYPERAGLEVQVFPPQADALADPHTGGEEHDPEGMTFAAACGV